VPYVIFTAKQLDTGTNAIRFFSEKKHKNFTAIKIKRCG